jgi:hypothetical protein
MYAKILLQEPCKCGSTEGRYVESEYRFWISCDGCDEFIAEEIDGEEKLEKEA